jgi:dienelactone hydrolase
MSSEHCITGSIHTGTPKGKLTTFAGRETYIAGSNQTNALLYLPDVFGHGLPNHQLLADTFAAELPVTVYVPDFLEGSEAPIDAEKRIKDFNFEKFRSFNSKEKRYPQILAYAQELKKNHQRVFGIGYCWGAWGSYMLGAEEGLMAGVSVNHPSLLRIPEDIENLKCDTVIVAPYTDSAFPPESRAIAEKIFDRKAKEEKLFSKIVVYPGFVHGFAARGDVGDAFSNDAIEDAKTETVLFIQKCLKKKF